MNRELTRIPVDERESRYVVKISGDLCAPLSNQARAHLFSLLQTCVSSPGILDCGSNTPQTIKISHDGERWLIVCEATGP
jgi:hypothetical protein